MTYAEKAKANFLNGCNCAQAVFLAFADEQMDRDTAMRLAAGLGGGMAGMRGICGAVTGIFLAYGLLRGSNDPTDQERKKDCYETLRRLAGEFEQREGTLSCRQLLGLDPDFTPKAPQPRTQAYYDSRPCPYLVEHAAAILEAYLCAN